MVDRGFLVLTLAAALLLVTSFAFAALAIGLRIRNDRASRRRRTLRNRWEPAMLEILGGAAPPEAIFQRVHDGDAHDFLEFLLEYARLLRGEEQDLILVMARPYLHEVIPTLREGAAESRGHAVLILARMGMPTYAHAVAGALKDDSPIVAMIAARSLFRPGQEQHFPAVLEHLPRFTGWSRSFLASMLAGGGPRAAPLLRAILADRLEPPLARAVASDALRELNDLTAVPTALRLLAEAQAQLPDQGSAGRARPAAGGARPPAGGARPPAGRARASAGGPRASAGGPRASGGVRPEDGGAETPDRELVVGCLRILEHLGHNEHLAAVHPWVDSPDAVIRAAAVSALAGLGGSAEIPVLQASLDDTTFWVSLEAARGLMSLGETATLERIASSHGPWSLLAQQVLTE